MARTQRWVATGDGARSGLAGSEPQAMPHLSVGGLGSPRAPGSERLGSGRLRGGSQKPGVLAVVCPGVGQAGSSLRCPSLRASLLSGHRVPPLPVGLSGMTHQAGSCGAVPPGLQAREEEGSEPTRSAQPLASRPLRS